MIKFEAEPRMKIGDKVWVAVENQKTGEITTEKALIVGYRISVVVTNAFQDMAVQYLTILANSSGFKLAPPTNPPSMSLQLNSSFALVDFTLPPY